MTKDQRDQVREMLHDILSGYHAKVDAQNTVTNAALEAMNIHFDKLNGTVAENRKIINENLPHSIIKCPQAKAISDLKENMISAKAIKGFIIGSIGVIGSLMAIAFIFYKMITKDPS